MHLGGHTPSFTCHLFEDVLFPCDYVIPLHGTMILNPYGPEPETRTGLTMLLKRIPEGTVRMVCSVIYVMPYPEWREHVAPLVG